MKANKLWEGLTYIGHNGKRRKIVAKFTNPLGVSMVEWSWYGERGGCRADTFAKWASKQASEEESIQQTHWVGCWKEHGHHGCAIGHAKRLREIVTKYLADHAPKFDWADPCECELCERGRREIER